MTKTELDQRNREFIDRLQRSIDAMSAAQRQARRKALFSGAPGAVMTPAEAIEYSALKHGCTVATATEMVLNRVRRGEIRAYVWQPSPPAAPPRRSLH